MWPESQLPPLTAPPRYRYFTKVNYFCAPQSRWTSTVRYYCAALDCHTNVKSAAQSQTNDTSTHLPGFVLHKKNCQAFCNVFTISLYSCHTYFLTFIGPCIVNIFAEYNQQDATFLNFFISVRCSTCFRWFFCPSSGAQNCTYSIRYLSDQYCYLLLTWPGCNILAKLAVCAVCAVLSS